MRPVQPAAQAQLVLLELPVPLAPSARQGLPAQPVLQVLVVSKVRAVVRVRPVLLVPLARQEQQALPVRRAFRAQAVALAQLALLGLLELLDRQVLSVLLDLPGQQAFKVFKASKVQAVALASQELRVFRVRQAQPAALAL